ncbi:MAG: hypothetical protein ABII12_09985 [Planctomycetota bacterium]
MSEFDPKLEQEVAAGERWLAGFSTPGPSPEAMERVRLSVRRELRRTAQRVGRWQTWHGVLAAAASIALAVTVGWYSSTLYETSAYLARADEVLAEWTDETAEQVVRFASLDQGLSELESWSASQDWSIDDAAMYEVLEEVSEDAGNGVDVEGPGARLAPLRGLDATEELS